MYELLLLFATTLLLDYGQSANAYTHMRILSDLHNVAPTKQLQSGTLRFLTITQRHLATYAHNRGEVLELTCEAVGAPAPSLHWFKNDDPVYEYDVESTELIDSNPSSQARVISTLLVKRTRGQDVYTCLVSAGSKTARATTVVYNTDGDTQLSKRVKRYVSKPRKVLTHEVYMDTIGNDIILPCRVKAHSKPHVTWKDNKGFVIRKEGRMKVLPSGELVILSLRWSDVGEFSCQATNEFGSQTAKTFVFPSI